MGVCVCVGGVITRCSQQKSPSVRLWTGPLSRHRHCVYLSPQSRRGTSFVRGVHQRHSAGFRAGVVTKCARVRRHSWELAFSLHLSCVYSAGFLRKRGRWVCLSGGREGEKSEITANGKRGHVTECRSEKEEEKRVR